MGTQSQTKIGELKWRAAILSEKLKEVVAAIAAEEKAIKTWPLSGDTVWFVSLGGEICRNTYEAITETSLDNTIALGQGFRTESEAWKEYHLQQTLKELRACEGRKPFVAGESNWGIFAELATDRLEVYKWNTAPASVFSLSFDTIDNARKAVEAVGRINVIEAARWEATKP